MKAKINELIPCPGELAFPRDCVLRERTRNRGTHVGLSDGPVLWKDNRARTRGLEQQQPDQEVIDQMVEIVSQLSISTALRISCLMLNGTIIYLLGTDHVNPTCQMEVNHIIDLVRPQKVVVELCKLRACRCPVHKSSIFQNPTRFTFGYMLKVISEIGVVPACIFMADVFSMMRAQRNVHLEFGGEMMGAIRHAKLHHECQVLLGDRCIAVTIKRRASAMNWWTKIRLILQVSLGLLFNPLRTPLLTSAHQVAQSDSMTAYIFIFERDLCLVNTLQKAANAIKQLKIVAVVGNGHANGIHRYWGKMRSDIATIIQQPKFNISNVDNIVKNYRYYHQ